MSDSAGDQLKLLATLHYVFAGISAFFSLFPILHIVMGLAIIHGKFPPLGAKPNGGGFPPEMGYVFVVMGAILIVIGLAIAAAVLVAAVKLSKRASYAYCFVVAIIACILFPIGTALGVFSLITLQKDAVKALFANDRSG